MSSRIQFDPPNPVPAEENEEVIFFNDGTIRVTQKAIIIGSPHNQAFAISQVIGVSYSKEKEGISTLFGIIIGFFVLFSSAACISNDSYLFGIVLGAFGLFMLKRSMTFAWCVSLKFAGLNNQTLFMKSKQHAVKLSDAITRAISHLPPPPPSGGEPVAYQPYFPNPANSLN